MPRLAHPDLPGQVIDVTESHAAVLAKSGWVPDGDTPTDSLDDPIEGDPTDPALAGNPEE